MFVKFQGCLRTAYCHILLVMDNFFVLRCGLHIRFTCVWRRWMFHEQESCTCFKLMREDEMLAFFVRVICSSLKLLGSLTALIVFPQQKLCVDEFANLTAESYFVHHILKDGLKTRLGRSSIVALVPPGRRLETSQKHLLATWRSLKASCGLLGLGWTV